MLHEPWLSKYDLLIDGSLGVLSSDAEMWGNLFYEKISLLSFPSSSDFYGLHKVESNLPFMIIGCVGRPMTFPICNSELPMGALGADVFDVLVNGKRCQALRAWILPL